MSEYQPLSSVRDLDVIDESECVAGYRAGLHGEPEPGNDKSKSYWHGWRNGMMDKGRMPIDAPARNLATEFVRRQRAH
jgi:ribosome modulation factor